MTIEKNIPYEDSRRVIFKFPLDELEINESFFEPDLVSRVRPRIKYYSDKRCPDRKFKCGIRHEGGIYGTRIWRIK